MSAAVAQKAVESAELSGRLNWLRAGVLGANDGIVSISATVVGVAAATNTVTPVLLAGVAAVVAGAISMALGEYVSVSSAADSQRSLITSLRALLTTDRRAADDELVAAYQRQGLTRATAEQVVAEIGEGHAVKAHLSQRFHLAEDEIVNPWHAAIASAVAFLAGAILPFLTILLTPIPMRIPVTVVAVLVALAITGGVGARLGGAPVGRAVLRVVTGGLLALGTTYAIGLMLGVSGI
ncbi:VIT1/CCC1 transporter family protein [Tessaracoccus sp. G1721]